MSGGGSKKENKISFQSYYEPYHGHYMHHLEQLLPALRAESDRMIWSAGDSSLDNKYWFQDVVPAVPGTAYERILDPPQMKPDITYWINQLAVTTQKTTPESSATTSQARAIMTSVEATTVNERTWKLREQDKFIRDNIQSQDILIVSVAGNDLALCPVPCTIASMACLTLCTPTACIENSISCGQVPCDDYCCGCGASALSCFTSCPLGVGYMRHLWGYRVQRYVEKLVAKTKPDKVFICTIYYPDEAVTESWAGSALAALGYNRNPGKLQSIIRMIFKHATSKIHIDGVKVIPLPMFEVLDGSNSSDYDNRVEPSPSGGRKMAQYFLDRIAQDDAARRYVPPTASKMLERS